MSQSTTVHSGMMEKTTMVQEVFFIAILWENKILVCINVDFWNMLQKNAYPLYTILLKFDVYSAYFTTFLL